MDLMIELIKNILKFFRTKDKVLNECIKNNILILEYKEIKIVYKKEFFNEKCFKINHNLWCFYFKQPKIGFYILQKYQQSYLITSESLYCEEFCKIINEYKINKKFLNKIKNYFFKFKNNIE